MSNQRIIKFRVWDTKNNKWFDDKKRCCHISYTTENFGVNKNFIFQQFTGLLDINKKEIYEGDIVKFKYMTGSPFNSDDKIIDKIGEIIWKDESFRIGWGYNNCNLERINNCDIIGNIFENPELLN